MLVEDEAKLAGLLKSTIGESFYRFSIAENGREGLELFQKTRPDIVITDIMMPEKNGLEMAREIKQIDVEIPIIILSAFSEKEKFLDAIDVGVVKYFLKPFDPEELLDYIESLEPMFQARSLQLANEFVYNRASRSLYKKHRYIALTKKEHAFLQLLIEQYDQGSVVADYETIKNTVWGKSVSDERLRTFVRRFREKTSKDLIQNIKEEGYRIMTAK